MKLLFDQNLSPKLADAIADLFPGSSHVRAEDLATATDREIWDHARNEGYAIVSKDSDFNDLVVMEGGPPEVVWIRIGNCTTDDIEDVLRENAEAIRELGESEEMALLELE